MDIIKAFVRVREARVHAERDRIRAARPKPELHEMKFTDGTPCFLSMSQIIQMHKDAAARMAS